MDISRAAGGPVRALCELAGIRNILSKSLGTSNSMNIIKAKLHDGKALFGDYEFILKDGFMDVMKSF